MKIINREHLLEVAKTWDNIVFTHPKYWKCFWTIRTHLYSNDISIDWNKNFVITENIDLEKYFFDIHIL